MDRSFHGSTSNNHCFSFGTSFILLLLSCCCLLPTAGCLLLPFGSKHTQSVKGATLNKILWDGNNQNFKVFYRIRSPASLSAHKVCRPADAIILFIAGNTPWWLCVASLNKYHTPNEECREQYVCNIYEINFRYDTLLSGLVLICFVQRSCSTRDAYLVAHT